MGIVFELPIIIYFLARFGIITAAFMIKNRKYAIVVILIVAAVITPTTDIFTQMLVAIPLWVLYEVSIIVAKRVEKNVLLFLHKILSQIYYTCKKLSFQMAF